LELNKNYLVGWIDLFNIILLCIIIGIINKYIKKYIVVLYVILR